MQTTKTTTATTAIKPIFNMPAHLKTADEKFFAMPLPEWAQETAAPVAQPEPWPVCDVCGREYAAWDFDGLVPDTSCWHCDKQANG